MKRPKATPERLGGREREIVDAIFALGNRATAEEIRARLKDPPGDSSVRVMLARLEKKGFLKHQQEGLRYVYSATVSPAAAKRTAFQRYVQTFFGGSRHEMLTTLIKESPWTDEELDALQAQIDRVRRERKGNHDAHDPPNHA
jgi:BlaI family penicillinase repressor